MAKPRGQPLGWGDQALDQLTTFGPADLAAIQAWVDEHGDRLIRAAYAATPDPPEADTG